MDDDDGDYDLPCWIMTDMRGKYIDEIPQSPKAEGNSYYDGDVAGPESTTRAPWASDDGRDSAEQGDNGDANVLWDSPRPRHFAKRNISGRPNGTGGTVKTRPKGANTRRFHVSPSIVIRYSQAISGQSGVVAPLTRARPKADVDLQSEEESESVPVHILKRVTRALTRTRSRRVHGPWLRLRVRPYST
ncbi:hypothetical protein B0H14DRAFT_2580868 [Mycena olivaceomarginata]|nr:hypothetical protein B0H14DRAFT_2580868 [Mycena olivaceomarginata]